LPVLGVIGVNAVFDLQFNQEVRGHRGFLKSSSATIHLCPANIM